MCNSLRLNQRPVDSIEIPDEPQHLGQPANSMIVAWLENSRDRAPCAEQSWAIEPDNQIGAWQADVEGRDREVAVADPRLARVRLLHQDTEVGDVILSPLRLPDRVEANHRRARAFT